MAEAQVDDRVTTARPANVLVYDTDVHHGCRSKDLLYPYLPPIYRDRFQDYGLGGGAGGVSHNGGVKGFRADALEDGKAPDFGGVSAPSPELTRSQLLDGCGIGWALLTGGPVGGVSAHQDLDYAGALARAFNDFSVDHWLGSDDRFRLAMAICARDPEAAAAEIRRMARNDSVVAIVLPGGALMPYGQRFYQPIHRACAENDIVFAIHFGSEGSGVNPPWTAAGYPSYYIENRMARPSFYQVHIASFIFEGVFERFPSLKVAVLEAGFSWIPAYLWKLDQEWKGLRSQVPWVRRPPTEYVYEHMRFSSQPEDEPPIGGAQNLLLEWMRADRTLMFATDYPHWDWDDPSQTLRGVPLQMRERIFAGNAATFFRS